MRDYDPTTGRYIEADPLGLVDGASVYGYVRQNPGRWTDPTGQCPWCVGLAIYAGWLVFDYLTDEDDCYTWGDFAWSAITNLDPSKFSKVGKALRFADRAADSKKGEKAFSNEKQALVEMAKMDKRKGITEADMEAYKQLNRELSDPFPNSKVRGPEQHATGAPSSREPHGHVGPVAHIPIRKNVP